MTMVMKLQLISKSKFKARALEYFRLVQRTGQPLLITERGRPVLKLEPYRETPEEALAALRGSILRYENPTEPVAPEAWEAVS